MKNLLKKSLAVLLVAIMAMTAAPLAGFKAQAAKITEFSVGDIVEFGSYPQSEVTDSALISALNSADGEWISYNYYSGTGRWDNGKMTPSDYMRYKDVEYGSEKYRGVVFDSYRPYQTGYTCTANYSYQDNNGYTTGNVYWFKYEPVQWRVLDPAAGLVMAEPIIDAQPYNNYILKSGIDEYGYIAYWGSSAKTYYANNYAESSIRKWLNEDFYDTAFSTAQQNIIEYTTLDNSAYSSSHSAYDSATTTDKIFLLSYNDALNTSYGFSNSTGSSSVGQAKPTAYAKAQGVYTSSGRSYWWLRSPGYSSDLACEVNSDGYIYEGGNGVSNDYGIRPALKLNLNSDIFQSDLSVSFSEGSYACNVGETFVISGNISSNKALDDLSLSWSTDGGVELDTPASIINSDDKNASFSITAKGLTAGEHTVTVTTSSGKSASCTVEVIEPESELVVSVEPVGGEYYMIGGSFYDSGLNKVSSLQYTVSIRNFYIAPSGTVLDDEAKEKLKLENVSATAALSDYTNLAIGIDDVAELKNIGTLAVNQSKTVIVDVTPIGTEIPKNVTLDVTATADGKASVTESAAISVKDKVYEPNAKVNFNITPQSVDYSDKKYSADSVSFTLTVTNAIPASFTGNTAKLKSLSDYDITLSEVKISAEDSKLLKNADVKITSVNKVLHAGESYTVKGTYNINTKQKMDKATESEAVEFSCSASTSANSPSDSKTVTFVNGDYDKQTNYKRKSLRELLEEMRNELSKCDVLTPAEKILVNNTITAHIMAIDMSDFKAALDAVDIVYEMASYVNDVTVNGYEKAGEYLIDAIINEADKSEEKIEKALNTCLEDLRDSKEFNKFAQWYADQTNVSNSSSKKVDVRCPVDVYAYDESGKEVLAIVGNTVVKAESGIHAFVCGDDKVFYLPTDADYDVKIIATGNGTMDYFVTEYSDDNELRKTGYEDIPLVVDECYTGVVTKHTMPDESTYNLTASDGTTFTYDAVEYINPVANIQLGIKTPSTTTVNYGETLVLHADLGETELPEGYSILWTIEGSGVTIQPSEDGLTCNVTSVQSGNVTVKATIVDENGEDVSGIDGNEITAEQQLTSKAGFWQKIVSFFKNLFGISRIILQSK